MLRGDAPGNETLGFGSLGSWGLWIPWALDLWETDSCRVWALISKLCSATGLQYVCAVVDKSGFLWTGSGAFLYGGGGTYSVLRFDTSITTLNDAAKPILAFAMPDESNVRTSWQQLH